MAIKCNRVQSIVAIKYNQSWQSSAIGCNHAPLPLDGPLLQSEAIKCNQAWQSSSIKCNHAPLPLDGPLLQLPLLLLLLCARRLRLADECLML